MVVTPCTLGSVSHSPTNLWAFFFQVSVSVLLLDESENDSGVYGMKRGRKNSGWNHEMEKLACDNGGLIVRLPSSLAADDFIYHLRPLLDVKSSPFQRRQTVSSGFSNWRDQVHWSLPYRSAVDGQPIVVTASCSVFSNVTGRS